MSFNRVRLDLHQLDRRDVPSVATPDEPPEYATASAEYRESYDQTLAAAVVALDAIDPIDPPPVGGEDNPADLPKLGDPIDAIPLPPGAKRDYTAEERAELAKLNKLLDDIKAQEKVITAVMATYDAAMTGALSVAKGLLDGLTAAKTEAAAAQKALDDFDSGSKAFNEKYTREYVDTLGPTLFEEYLKLKEKYDPKNREPLVKKRDEANGKVAGSEAAVKTAAEAVKLIQQRLDYLAAWAKYYKDYADAINARINAIHRAVGDGVASGTPLDTTTNPLKAITFPPDFKNLDKPLTQPTGSSGGVTAPVPGK